MQAEDVRVREELVPRRELCEGYVPRRAGWRSSTLRMRHVYGN